MPGLYRPPHPHTATAKQTKWAFGRQGHSLSNKAVQTYIISSTISKIKGLITFQLKYNLCACGMECCGEQRNCLVCGRVGGGLQGGTCKLKPGVAAGGDQTPRGVWESVSSVLYLDCGRAGSKALGKRQKPVFQSAGA